MTQVRENLRPLWAFVCIAGLCGTAQASLIPDNAEVLFSTSRSSLSLGNGFKVLRTGDVLNNTGTISITNWDLVKQFEPASRTRAGFGLDGLSVFKWASGKGRPLVYFSTNTSFYSNKLGKTVGDGDLLNKRGEIVATNQQLLSEFVPTSNASFGLDAFDILNPTGNREIWFSTATNFHSDILNADIGAGDVLSSKGELIATNAELLAAFQPRNNSTNYGVDALHVASTQGDSPEIWFSVSQPFYSDALKRTIAEGDLISNKGEIVATNAELMNRFGFRLPMNSTGLDAFSITRTIGGEGRVTPPPAVPEPATVVLLALGGLLVTLRRRAAA